METAKVLYEYQTMLHGQLVTVKRYEPMLPSDAFDIKFFEDTGAEDEQV
jgi:hypothetical protein